MGSGLVVTKVFEVWDSDRPVLEMLAEARKVKCSFLYHSGKTSMVVAGTEKKLRRIEKDLETNKLLRSKGAIETVIDSLTVFTKRLGNAVGSMREDWDSVHITRDGNEIIIRIGYFEDEGAKPNESDIPDNNGVLGEVPCAEENGVLLDTQGFDKGENGYLPDDDSGRSGDTGEETGKTVVDLPADFEISEGVLSGERARNAVADIPAEVQEKGEWLTKAEYSARYDVRESTIDYWIGKGILKVDKDAYPRTVFDGEKVPVHKKRGKRYYWEWVDRDILEDANSQVNEEL